jgi:hypothetical protein
MTNKLDEHYWLTQSMARALGLSISGALRDERLTHDDLSLIVARCVACGRKADCTQWLAHHGAGAPDLPEYCAIAPDLRAVARARAKPGR